MSKYISSLTINNLTATNVVATDGMKKIISIAHTGTGNNVLANTPTISSINANNTVITNVSNPVASTDAANKSYVDASAQGLKVKDSSRVATTVAGTLASDFENGDTIDGVVLATNDRILIKNQASGIENGIYVVNASGAPTRSADLAAASAASSAYTFITEGTSNANSGWLCSNATGSDVVGTDALTFTQFSGAGQISAGTGLTKIGSVLSVNASQTQVTAVGTLTTGIWNASVIPVLYGGTGTTTSTGTGDTVLSISPMFSGTVNAAAITTTGLITAGAGLNITTGQTLNVGTSGTTSPLNAYGLITGSNGLTLSSGNVTMSSSTLGISLNSANAPLITRAINPFTSGAYNGLGRWGAFMETDSLTLGIPVFADQNNAYFRFATYNANSTIAIDVMRITALGVVTMPANISSTNTTTGTNVITGGLGVSENVNIGGTLTVNSKNMTPSSGDILAEVTFVGAENQTNTNVTGLAFVNASTRSFQVQLSIVIVATTSIFAHFEIIGIQNASGWYLSSSYVGDNTLTTFAITSLGQVQYTNSTYTGFTSLTMKFKAITLSI